MKVFLQAISKYYSKASSKTGKFIQRACSKTKPTRMAYNKYADITNIYKTSRRAGRIFAHQGNIRSVFTGVNAVRKEVGYFPLFTAAAGGAAGYCFIPLVPGPTVIGLLTGIGIKNGAKNLIKLVA